MGGREVVITGIGLTTPMGKNVSDNWSAVTSMKTGIAHFPAEGHPEYFQYAGKVSEYDIPPDIPPKQQGQMKFLNRGAILGLSASYEAVVDHLEGIEDLPPGRRALYIASGDFTKIGYEFMYPAIKESVDNDWQTVDQRKLNDATLNRVNPFFLLESLHNNLFSFLSAFIQFMGPNTSLASLSPNGGNAMELAYRSIKQNNADVALAVGYGCWNTEIPLYELEGLGILSKCRSGIHSYRPFDKDRDGFIAGEGGAAVLLESADSAVQRGAEILGRVIGVGNYTEFSPNKHYGVHEKVIKRNLLSLMEDTGSNANDLAFVIPHGSGTRKGDRSEVRSLMDVFRDKMEDIPLCGLKPYTGHMGAASDIAEMILGIQALKSNTVPATLNFKACEKEFSGLRLSNSPQTCDKNRFLSVSYGVGGQSSSVMIEGN